MSAARASSRCPFRRPRFGSPFGKMLFAFSVWSMISPASAATGSASRRAYLAESRVKNATVSV